MPPTLVHAALGGLLAAALLDRAFSARAVAVVVGAAALPDLDAPLALLFPGAHGALLHTLLIPAGAAALLYYDARREAPWLSGRYGPAGVRIAWVAVLAYALAGTGLDLLNLDAANPVWPAGTMYYSLVGKLEYSTTEGFVQTFYSYDPDGRWTHYVGQRGRYPYFCKPSLWQPGCGNTGSDPRTSAIVQSGWQLLLVAATPAVLLVRKRLGGRGER
ncbi:metal-dependent hydrolase [Salinirubellus sp. GCM10025818]|uniref:metal-dependent hydrolase n=1 Tax=Salinirubellus TaxID=2162630 RepID=UPI0030D3F448